MPESLIYLDHHATTPLDERVLEVMSKVWRGFPGNAASTSHQAGHASRRIVGEARDSIATLLHCQPREIIFTSGATEANNLAIRGLAGQGSPQHIVTSAAEHRAVLDPVRRLRREGHSITILPVDRVGRIDAAQLTEALTPQTKLVSVMLANNEIGTLNDLQTLCQTTAREGLFVHTDAAQAVGKIPVRLDRLRVDLMSFTAHKVYGPQGIGALFVRRADRRVPLAPLFDGGGHEQGLRSGTLPVALIAGFAKALELAIENMDAESERISSLREDLWQRLSRQILGVTRNGDPDACLPGNLNVTLPDINGEALLAKLQQTRLCLSSGSACTSANPEPSHVLKAIGLADRDAKSSLRFGLGRETTSTEIHEAVDILTQLLSTL